MVQKKTEKVNPNGIGMTAPKAVKLAQSEEEFLEDAGNVFPAARVVKKPNKKYAVNPNKAPVKELSNK